MRFDHEFYRHHQGGSTNIHDMRAAERLSYGTRPLARAVNRVLRFPSRDPSVIFGGAGSDKFARLGAYQTVDDSTQSFFLLDVGGQFLSTGWHYNLRAGRKTYTLNSQGVSSYSDINHPVDLFAPLIDDAQLFDKARAVAGMALTETDSKGDNAWVGQGAKRWLSRIITSTVRLERRTTPNRTWEVINAMDTDDEFLKNWGRACEGLPNDEYSVFVEIYRKKKGSEKEYGAIMGKIKDDLDWLSSKAVADSISGDTNYFADLGDPNGKIGVYFVVKGGTTKDMQSYIRLVVGIAQLNCVHAGEGAVPLFYLEEAASMGAADFIRKAVSEYRKYMETVLVYQSLGQLSLHFSREGAQEILDSCGTHIYMGGGIRSIHSARDIADAIGRTTIDVDMHMEQADRAYKANTAAWGAFWHGEDMLASLSTIEHERMQSHQQRQTGRHAIDPAELMRLKDQVLIMTPGSGLQPVLAQKLPMYFDAVAMAGRYGPDPLFPPLDRVSIRRKFFGRTTRRFIRRSVPRHLAHWPNHINGEIAYVEGYRTW